VKRINKVHSNGFVLLPVVVALTLIAAIAFLINRESANSLNMAASDAESSEMQTLAEAAINHAIWVADHNSCSGYSFPTTDFGEHSYSATYTPDNGSPVAVSATATHVNGNTRTLNRSNQKIYDNTITTVLQPNASEGKDTFIEGANGHTDHNKKTDKNLTLKTESNKLERILIQFDLGTIPDNVKILSAVLELDQNKDQGSETTVYAHRLRQSWTEADVTWESVDGTNDWPTDGGDYDIQPAASFVATGTGWKSLQIANLLQLWLSGIDNNGIILLAEARSGNNEKKFTSSDDNDSTKHPKLTVTYACECGQTCVAENASGGKLLFVVVNDSSLTSQEQTKKEYMESWGYTVSVIDQSDSQSNYDTAIANNDVVFIGEEVFSSNVNTKLVNASIGIVSEEIALTDEFGFSSDNSSSKQDSLDIVNNAHYITEPFSLGSLKILKVKKTMWAMTGSIASGQETLANTNAGIGVTTLEYGALMVSGNRTDGRRVMLPWGDDAADITKLNDDGLTIFQRALEWAVQIPPPPAACSGDLVPDTKIAEFSTESIDIGDPTGITYLPAGTVFNNSTSPTEGAWLIVDGGDKHFHMVDTSGSELTDITTSTNGPKGVALITAGTWNNHLALTDIDNLNIYILNLNGAIQALFSTSSFSEHPLGITFIETSESGTYDNHLAIVSDKDGSGDSKGNFTIIDQTGAVISSVDISSFVEEPLGIAHMSGTDKFLIAENDGAIYTVDFSGNLVRQYDPEPLDAKSPVAIMVNPLNCNHVILDKDDKEAIYLNLSTAGS
jgi:hypothetical protein